MSEDAIHITARRLDDGTWLAETDDHETLALGASRIMALLYLVLKIEGKPPGRQPETSPLI